MKVQMVKPSQYNHFFSYSDGLRLAYNSLSGSIINLTDENGSKIESMLLGNNDINNEYKSDLFKKLINLKFLIDNDVDELNIVKHIFRNTRTIIEKPIMLTILPTLGCNFGCNYCFEKHIKGIMSIEVQDALIEFVCLKLLPFNNNLSIEWFGGEPLLGISVIERLYERLKEVCVKFNTNVHASSIITNGYLLDNKMSHKLVNMGITSAQITIDGTPEIHNRRRPLVNGKGSFEKIIENIKNASEDLKISIRINVDGYNKDCIFDLIKFFYDEKLIPKVKPYIARVESFSEECRSSEGFFLTSEQFAKFQEGLRHRCIEAGIPWFSNSTPRLNACGFCIVDNLSAFVIEPNGRLLKCWAEAGNNTGTEIANLLERETWNSFAVSPLQNRDPFDDQECCNCKILPACMGGCPRTRENHRDQGYKECPPMRYSLSDDVRHMYDMTNKHTS